MCDETFKCAMPDFLHLCYWPLVARVQNVTVCFSFAMWNTMMGTSLLSMPWAIEQVGALALYPSPKAAPDNK